MGGEREEESGLLTSPCPLLLTNPCCHVAARSRWAKLQAAALHDRKIDSRTIWRDSSSGKPERWLCGTPRDPATLTFHGIPPPSHFMGPHHPHARQDPTTLTTFNISRDPTITRTRSHVA